MSLQSPDENEDFGDRIDRIMDEDEDLFDALDD